MALSPSPVRALLAAHGQQAWNAMRRQTGAAGAAATALTLLVVLFALTPIVLFGIGFGYTLGGILPGADTRLLARAWLAGFHLSTVVCLGVWGGLTQVVRFEWEAYRVFPVTPARLLFAELLLAPLDLPPLLSIVSFGALAAGLGLEDPALLPGALALALCGIASTLALKTLVGAAKKALLRRLSRLSTAGILGTLAALAALAVLAVVIARREGSEAAALGATRWLLDHLPSARSYGALGEVPRGDASSFLASLPAAVGLALSALAAAVWAHARAARLEPRPKDAGTAERLWGFRAPRHGVARLTLEQLRSTSLGRLLLLFPLALSAGAAIAAKIPSLPFGDLLAKLPATFPWPSVLGVVGLLFGARVFWNQYGLDRHGIKTLLLMPIAAREVILGKLLALATLSGLGVVATVAPFLAVLPLSPPLLVQAIGATLAAFLALGALGHVVSVRFPMRESGETTAAPPLVGLLVSVLTLALVSALAAAYRWGAARGPWGSAAALVALALLAIAAYALALPLLERNFYRSRERLVEELG